jgi:DNA-binding response OmpR family regulator
MTEDNPYRALVVDGEPPGCSLVCRALNLEGFVCDATGDGLEAKRLIASNPYDLVVTELQIPKRHGHALAVEILGCDKRPVIAILTRLRDPRLAKDLIARGVDCFECKPVNYALFAAKLAALVWRRRPCRDDDSLPGRWAVISVHGVL